jgi:hypothetical protein
MMLSFRRFSFSHSCCFSAAASFSALRTLVGDSHPRWLARASASMAAIACSALISASAARLAASRALVGDLCKGADGGEALGDGFPREFLRIMCLADSNTGPAAPPHRSDLTCTRGSTASDACLLLFGGLILVLVFVSIAIEILICFQKERFRRKLVGHDGHGNERTMCVTM